MKEQKERRRDGISLTINNERISVGAGTTIKEAAAVIGVNIPGLCHLSGREDASEPCLICMVEVNGEMAEACRTQVAADMVVRTSTPAIDKHRRQRLEYLLSFHYGVVSGDCLEIHPDDAVSLGISSGMEVEVCSRRGAVRLPAVVTERSRPGSVFTTFHFAKPLVNTITSPGKDEIAGTPEYKVCAVAVSPVPAEKSGA